MVHVFVDQQSQQVKNGGKLSPPLTLTAGVPQGGVLSSVVFTVYTCGLQYHYGLLTLKKVIVLRLEVFKSLNTCLITCLSLLIWDT